MTVPEEKKKFNEKEEAFIDYLATPADLRQTQKELAETIGVTPKTLSLWKKRPEIIEAAYKRKVELVKANDTPEIIDALVKKAKEGSYNHIKLFKEWFYDNTPKNRSLQQINISFPEQIKPQTEENTIEVEFEGGD